MKKRHSAYQGVLLGIGACLLLGTVVLCKGRAGAAETTQGALRVLVTADLHGQVTAWNPECDEPDPEVGLSKLATVIRDEREAVGENNILLVDAGDTLYSYSTDFYYTYNQNLIQPIYQAMASLNYDAVTLGNHELDYPWEYLKNQLDSTKLMDVVTVSNLLYDDSGDNVLAPSIVTEKEISLSDGTTKTVRIGVIGATRAAISSKRQRYSGYLCGQAIYESVKAEAEKLKNDGVDIVIALIHGGIGVLSGSDTAVSPGGRLAKLPEIDAVVTSHTHEAFPLDNGTYKDYPQVDEEKGLVYGTPVIGTGSHARALGVIDLPISVSPDGKITVTEGQSSLRWVDETTEEDASIVSINAKCQKTLQRKLDKEEYKLAEGCVLTNTDCVVRDTALFQLLNNAKLEFGSGYVQEYLPEYKDYPLIAVTVNHLDNKDDYIMIEDSVNSTDIAKVISIASSERDSGYLYLYKISGKNLREWLEYNASIYAKAGTKFTTILPNFTKKNKQVSTLLQEEYLKDWSSFFVFDGIDYEIDLSVGPRYLSNGKYLSTANKRIKNLTWQGKEVKDSQEFVLVSDAYNLSFWFMPTSAENLYANTPWFNGKDFVMKYIQKESELGELNIQVDNNWRFYQAEGYEFAFGTDVEALAYGKQQDWYYKHVSGTRIGLQFFWGRYVTPKQKLNVLLAQGVTNETCRYVPVQVTVASLEGGAGVKEMVYRKGRITSVDDLNWNYATAIHNSIFQVSDNDTYSVRVTDTFGNQTIAYIVIKNINPYILDTPQMTVVTNRLRTIKGVAIPESTVHAKTEDGNEYIKEVDSDGKFTVEIPPQRADSIIDVWITEGYRTSEIVKVTIYRTGPNLPEVINATGGNSYIICGLDEDETPVIIMGRKAYVVKGQKDSYVKSSVYNANYPVIEVPEMMVNENHRLYSLPVLKKGATIYLYAIDWQNRASLRVVETIQ